MLSVGPALTAALEKGSIVRRSLVTAMGSMTSSSNVLFGGSIPLFVAVRRQEANRKK